MKMLRRTFTLFALCASLALTSNAMAQDWPLAGGDYWDVTGVIVQDGGGYKYASWLASEWRKNNEFAKSKGWIKDFFVLSNEFPRKGEPDLYLVRVFESMPNAAESEKRGEEYREWSKKSLQTMAEESGNRAEFREVSGSSLLQRLNFRD